MFPLRWAKQLPLKCQVDVRWRRDGTTLHIFLSESPQNKHGSGIRRIELFLINTNNIYTVRMHSTAKKYLFIIISNSCRNDAFVARAT